MQNGARCSKSSCGIVLGVLQTYMEELNIIDEQFQESLPSADFDLDDPDTVRVHVCLCKSYVLNSFQLCICCFPLLEIY